MNRLEQYFDSSGPGKAYALFTDIGNGIAPSKTFKVQLKGNLLVLPAVKNQNEIDGTL